MRRHRDPYDGCPLARTTPPPRPAIVNEPSRRRFVTALGASALTIVPGWVQAGPGPTRALRFDNLHTNEKLSVA